jgi:hypothetical protein
LRPLRKQPQGLRQTLDERLSQMSSWRVTKYDPRHRDSQGRYKRDEWIGPAQIGQTFPDGALTEAEYLRVENLYIAAALAFLRTGSPSMEKLFRASS